MAVGSARSNGADGEGTAGAFAAVPLTSDPPAASTASGSRPRSEDSLAVRAGRTTGPQQLPRTPENHPLRLKLPLLAELPGSRNTPLPFRSGRGTTVLPWSRSCFFCTGTCKSQSTSTKKRHLLNWDLDPSLKTSTHNQTLSTTTKNPTNILCTKEPEMLVKTIDTLSCNTLLRLTGRFMSY